MKNDTIYNGADDNASTCVALLAMGRAYSKQPAKRSILFVIHGAEERGLLGSRWHSAHPVVPRENIVAVLNGDMIGRNDINEAALLGGQSPHKNSDDLVRMAEEANQESTKFKFLKDWDLPEHPEFFLFPKRPPALCKAWYSSGILHKCAAPPVPPAAGRIRKHRFQETLQNDGMDV